MNPIIQKYLSLSFLCLLFSINLSAQDVSWMELKDDKNATFEQIQEAFHTEWDGKEYERGQGYKQFYRWESFWENRLMPDGSFPNFSNAFTEYQDYKVQHGTSNTSKSSSSMLGNWLPLGPFDINGTQSWSPGTGRVNTIVQDPNDENIIYIGAPAGGVWKTTDAGSTWTPLSDQLSVIGISSIAIDPSNSDIIYIATGDADGGDTYEIGIWKSEDAGENWFSTGSNIGQSNKLLIDPIVTTTIWSSGDNGLYKSINSGNSWTQVLTGNIKDMALKPGDAQTVYGVSSTNFYYSTNGGNNFNTASGLSGNTNRLVIGVTPANSSYVYVVAADDSWAYEGVYRSTDSGMSFSTQNTTGDIFNGSGQTWYDLAVTVSDTDENTIIVGVLNLWRSTNGGTSWSELNSWSNPGGNAYTHADIHYLNYYDGNLYCGSDGGIYKSTNNGNSFTDLTAGVQIGQFYTLAGSPNDVNVLAGGLQDNGGYAWTSNSWKVYYGADGMGSAVNHNNSNNIFGMIQFGNMYYTTNGGFNLEGVGTGDDQGGRWVTPMEWDPNNNRIIAGYDDVFEFNNSTLSWNQLSDYNFPAKISLIEIYEGNSDIIFVSTGDDLYITTNNGDDFTEITGSLSGNVSSIEVNPSDSDELWVSIGGWSNGNKVFHTEDGGMNWSNFSGSLPNLPTNIIKYDAGNNAHYLGMDIGVYYRDDILGDWIPYNDNLPNVIVNDIEINETNSVIRIGTYGRGVWESGTYDVPVVADNLSLNFINSPVESSCETEIVPEIEVRNVGSNDIESFDIEYDVDGGDSFIESWEGTLSPGSAVVITFSMINVSFGEHTFNVTLTDPNGNLDGELANNSGSSDFEAIDGNEAVFSLTTDCWENETSWMILDSEGNIVREAPQGTLQDETTEEWNICLANDCYELIINDSYGDGLSNGSCNIQGEYTLFDEFGEIIVDMEETNFGYQAIHEFCLPNNGGCIDSEACNFDSNAMVDLGNCIYPDGCTDSDACNYNITAQCDDGTCFYPGNLSISTDVEICYGDSTVLFAEGGESYSWNELGDGQYQTVSPVSTSTYIVTIEESNGCESVLSTVVTVVPIPVSFFIQDGNLLTAIPGDSYQWYLNGEEIDGAIEQTYSILEDGNYSVEIANYLGCSNDASEIFASYTGINELQNESFNLFPNPMNETGYLTFEQDCNDCIVRLTSSNGQLVREYKNIIGKRLTIERQGLSAGNYVLQIYSKEKSVKEVMLLIE